MSYEVFGDGDDDDIGYYAEHFLKEGWWDEDTVARVIEAMQALSAEPVYEGGDKDKGISVRFLMRINILRDECGLMEEPEEIALVAEARAALETGDLVP